jgi:hypothetical protein
VQLGGNKTGTRDAYELRLEDTRHAECAQWVLGAALPWRQDLIEWRPWDWALGSRNAATCWVYLMACGGTRDTTRLPFADAVPSLCEVQWVTFSGRRAHRS